MPFQVWWPNQKGQLAVSFGSLGPKFLVNWQLCYIVIERFFTCNKIRSTSVKVNKLGTWPDRFPPFRRYPQYFHHLIFRVKRHSTHTPQNVLHIVNHLRLCQYLLEMGWTQNYAFLNKTWFCQIVFCKCMFHSDFVVFGFEFFFKIKTFLHFRHVKLFNVSYSYYKKLFHAY